MANFMLVPIILTLSKNLRKLKKISAQISLKCSLCMKDLLLQAVIILFGVWVKDVRIVLQLSKNWIFQKEQGSRKHIMVNSIVQFFQTIMNCGIKDKVEGTWLDQMSVALHTLIDSICFMDQIVISYECKTMTIKLTSLLIWLAASNILQS